MAMEAFGFRGYHINKLKRFGSHLLEINSLHEESFVISLTNFPSKCKMRKKQLKELEQKQHIEFRLNLKLSQTAPDFSGKFVYVC